MTACGRKRPVISLIFEPTERPLSGKADIQILVVEKLLWNDRLRSPPDSGHSDDIVMSDA